MAQPLICFRDVSKVFRRADGRGDLLAVDRLSLEVGEGEIVAVLGKTGCGKSTMFNLIAGLIEPTSGEVTVRAATIRSAISNSSAARSASCFRAIA
jgi:NitT/TauT family transport system ATP-binding protein